jgi:hypothetical protein
MAMADANILRKGWQNDIDYCTVQYTEALRQYKNFTRLNKKEDADKWKQKADYCSKERDRLVEEAKQDGFIYKNGRVKADTTKWPEVSQKRTLPTTVKEAASSVSAGTGHSEKYNSSNYVKEHAAQSDNLRAQAADNANKLLNEFDADQKKEHDAAVELYKSKNKGNAPANDQELKEYGFDADKWSRQRQNGINKILTKNPDLSISEQGFIATGVQTRTSSYVNDFTFTTPYSNAVERLDILKKQQAASEKHKEAIKTAKLNDEKAFKEYQDAMAKNRAEQKKKLETQATERKKVIDKNKQALEQNAKDDAKKTSDKLDEYIKNSKPDAFTGTAKDAKNNLKQIGKILTEDLKTEVKNSSGSNEYGTIGYAKDMINQLKNPLDFSKNSVLKDPATEKLAKTLAENSKETQLTLETLKMTQKMSAQIVIDTITQQIYNQKQTWKTAGKTISDMALLQKAYMSAYIKNTFGNPEFMKKVTASVSVQINNYIDATIDEKINNLDKKVDNTFTKIDNKINTVTNKINNKLDKLKKLDILFSLNKKLDKCLSLDSFEAKMNKNPVTAALAAPLLTCARATATIVSTMITSSKFVSNIKAVQNKIARIQNSISNAKKLVQEKVQQLKTYVNNLKNQAVAVVKSYATKVINDIASKISISGVGAIKL